MTDEHSTADTSDRAALRGPQTPMAMGSAVAFSPLSPATVSTLRWGSGALALAFTVILVYTIQTDGSPFR